MMAHTRDVFARFIRARLNGNKRADDPAAARGPTLAQTRAGATFAASLAFENVARQFDDADGTPALAGVTLKIEPGEIVCLLGPSGSGKTTLLRIASGIERPTGGRVLINGEEIAGPEKFVAPEHRNVGLMFQDFALFPHLSIVDNVAFGLTALNPAVARTEALALLARVRLAHHAESFPSTLSGGEQQRVALARALAPRPAVMLMDEPFSGLDVQLRDAVLAETLALLRETRATCLVVTHSPAEALRMADRLAVMRKGRLVQTGRAQELWANPADLFVARLFSEINEVVLPVRGGVVKTPVGAFPTPGIADGSNAVVCIRRQALSIASGPGMPGVPARILGVRFLGDSAEIEIGATGFDAPLSRRVRSDSVPAVGTEVFMSVDPAGVLVFPADV